MPNDDAGTPQEPQALDSLFADLYPELRRLARARLRDGGRNTVLDTTSLVHEAYLRVVASGRFRPEDRGQFMCYASRAMRSVIVDIARERQSQRRGGDVAHVTLTTQIADGIPGGEDEIVRVHEALDELARLDERLARVVEMRYFAGLAAADIAASLGVAERTVQRDWDKARLLLAQALR